MKNLIYTLLLAAFTVTAITAAAQTADTTTTVNTFKNGKPKPKNLNQRHYVTIDEIGGIFGFSGYSKGKYFFSYHSCNAYQINRYMYIGPGFGIEVSGPKGLLIKKDNSTTSMMIPVFVEYRATLGTKRVAPIVSQKVGYSFYLPAKNPGLIGGVMAQSQIGMKVFLNDWATMNFSVGYRLQYLDVPEKYYAQFNDMREPLPNQSADDLPRSPHVFQFATFHVGFTY